MDTSTSSRRAFPLNSRAVWVEQQIVGENQVLLARDNLVLGPGEYSPTKWERHISTPSLGRCSTADYFESFKSNLSSSTPLHRKTSPKRVGKKRDPNSEFMTVFHEHDVRQPLDPKTRYCTTPGAYLSQDPMLQSRRHDGVNFAKKIHFGPNNIPFGERNKTKVALKDYDVKFDSNQLKPSVKQGSFSTEKRIYVPLKENEQDSDGAILPYNDSQSALTDDLGNKNAFGNGSGNQQHLSVFQKRLLLVPLPKLNVRRPPQLIFDASSYKYRPSKRSTFHETNSIHKNDTIQDLNPAVVDRQAQAHLFNHILSIPRKHYSKEYRPGMSSSI